jgi:hypothetical protein
MTDGTLVIARGELTPALRQRLSFDPNVLVFSGSEAAHALTLAVQRGLSMVALDRQFASSGSGADFVSELRSLRPDSEIRILSDQGTEIPVVLRRPVLSTGRTTIAAGSQPLGPDVRRAPRYPVQTGCEAMLNGHAASLVNVSVCGAQVLSPVVLRPMQHVRVALTDEETGIRLQAAIAWSMFERSRITGETCYRVGVEFTDANRDRLAAYCSKYGLRF